MHFSADRCGRTKTLSTTEKQETLYKLLREAALCMFSSKYVEAILLYEEAINLIGSEDCNVTELDVCVIGYTLCKCYYTVKGQYYMKAIDKLLTLIMSRSRLLPVLYYGLALIYYDLNRCELVDDIIKHGLDALTAISNKDSFKANWPATQIAIPETDYTNLMNMFKALQKLNLDKRTVTVEYNLNEESSNACYQSGETLSKNDETEQKHAEGNEDNNYENVATGGIEATDMDSKVEVQDLYRRNDGIVLTEETKIISKTKSLLKADVPEFVPRNTAILPPSYNSTNASTNLYEPMTSVNNKFCQTIKFETTDAQVQANLPHADTFKQTLAKISKDIAVQTSKMIPGLEENAILQEKIRDLEAQMFTYQRHALELETTLKFVKVEMQELKTDNKNLTKKLHRTEVTLQTQAIRNCDMQRVRITDYVNKCVKMISDLSVTLSMLTMQSNPTIADCHRSIDEWKVELHEARQCLEHCKEFSRQLTSDVAIDNCAVLDHFSDLFMRPNEPRSILHDNYVRAICSLVRGNEVSLTQNKHFQEQYMQWWNNYGRFQQRPAAITVPPQYYPNQPSIENVPTNSAPVQSRPRNPAVVTTPSDDANTMKQETSKSTVDHIIYDDECIENWDVDEVTDSSNLVPSVSLASSNSTNQTESVSNTERNISVQPFKIKSTSKVTQKWSVFETKGLPAASNVVTKGFASLKLTDTTDDYSSSEDSIKTSNSTRSESIQKSGNTPRNTVPHQVKDFKAFGKTIAASSEASLRTSTPVTCLSRENESKSSDSPNMYSKSNIFLTAPTNPLSPNDRLIANLRNQPIETLPTVTVSPYASAAPGSHARTTVNSFTLDTQPRNVYKAEHQYSFSKTNKSEVAAENLPKSDPAITAKLVNSRQANTSSTNCSLQNNGSNVTANSTVGGPHFAKLFEYIKNNLPDTSDKEILCALNKVREKKIRLTGMAKTVIFAAVQAELKEDMGSDRHITPSASPTVNSSAEAGNTNRHDCVICLEMLGEGVVSALQCGHSFHKHCLRRWTEANNSCPVCQMYIF